MFDAALKDNIMEHIDDLGKDGFVTKDVSYADTMDLLLDSVESNAYLQIYSWEEGCLPELKPYF